ARRSSGDLSSRLAPDFTIRRACARVADDRAPWRIRADIGRKLTRSLAYDVPREGPATGAISKDILAALRQFRRRPSFTWAVAITLALSIGANVAVFSVVNAVLLRALPFSNPERLVWIASVRSDNPSAPFTLPEYIDYRGQTRSLAGLAAFTSWTARLGTDRNTEGIQGARISANAFDVLGATPAAGRLFHDTDDRPDAPKAAVLSYRLWQQRFHGAVGAIGSTVRF